MTIGERIKALRREQGLTQHALADKVYVARSMITQIELGLRAPSAELRAALATALGTEEAALTGTTDT